MASLSLGAFNMPINFNLKFLDVFDSDQLNELSKALNEIAFPIRHMKKKDFTEQVQRRFPDIEPSGIIGLHEFLKFVLYLNDDYNDYTQFVELLSMQEEEEPRIEAIRQCLRSLQHVEEYYREERLEGFKNRGNYFVEALSYGCDLRGQFAEDFDYNTMDIKEYSPDLVGLVPMVSLRIRYRVGNKVEFVTFQADEDRLDYMINRLMSAQKELKILNKSIGESKNG